MSGVTHITLCSVLPSYRFIVHRPETFIRVFMSPELEVHSVVIEQLFQSQRLDRIDPCAYLAISNINSAL